MVDFENKSNTIEVYDKIKKKYESSVASNEVLKEPEIEKYLKVCKEHIDKIESIKQKVLELGKTQIIQISNYENEINDVKIIVTAPLETK